MKNLLLIAAALLLSGNAWGMQRISGFCQQGGKIVVAPAVLGGVPLTRSFQQSYPRCTVTVFVTGSGGTLATIYSANSLTTRITNPMQADVNGFFDFYVPSCNQRYDVNISGGGLAAPFTFGDNLVLDLTDCSLFTGKLTMTGFISTGGQYDDFTSNTGGAFFRSLNIRQAVAGTSGGYIKLSPITYNPNNGPPVFDIYGNPVRDPVYLPGDSLQPHDAVLFVAEATDLIPNPDLIFGIFTNQYMFSRVGFATDYASEASIQSLNGGMQALSFAAVNYVNSGQHAGIPPLTPLDQFHPGAIYYDTSLGCERVFNGTAWACMGSGGGGGGSAAGSNTQVQYNGSGALAASADFTFDPSLRVLNLVSSSNAAAAINAQVGFIQSSGGFVSTNSSIQSVQAPTGGMNALAFAAVSYIQSGNSSGIPGLVVGDSFHAGALYWDTAATCERVFNGSTWSCLGSGGTGTPGGSNTNVQFNTAGSFGGSSNFTWVNGSQLLNIIAVSPGAAGVNVQVGFIQAATGFVAVPTSATAYNAFNGIGGGMAAKSFTAINYIQTGNSSGAPAPTSGDSFHPGALYWDTGANCEEVNNGSGWSCLGTGGGGVPGGANTNVQFNASGAFSGSSNFTWTNSTQLLNVVAFNPSSAGINVQIGFIQSAGGFVADPGIAITYNAVSAVGGGMAAHSFTADRYVQTGNNNGVPTLSSGDSFHPGALYWDTGASSEKVFNGVAWVNLSGGGGGTPAGIDTQIQYNNSGAFGASASFTWDDSLKLFSIISSGSAGINVSSGFIQSDGGYVVNPFTGTTFNSFNSVNGGIAVKTVTATNYVQTGNSFGTPGLTSGDSFHAGTLYWDLGVGQEMVFNGVSFVALSGGGGGGSPGGVNQNVQFNSAGTFAGSNNFNWSNGSQLLNVVGTSNAAASINSQVGFIQSAGGFNTSQTTYSAIQAPVGGVAARSITSSTYSELGQSFGIPTVTPGDSFQRGSIFWNQGSNELWLNTTGSSPSGWVPIISGAGAFVGTGVNVGGGTVAAGSLTTGGLVVGTLTIFSGSGIIANNLNISGTITAPGGATSNGTFTCPGGQHVNSINISQGLILSVACN